MAPHIIFCIFLTVMFILVSLIAVITIVKLMVDD